jgi:fumarate reductase subunit D
VKTFRRTFVAMIILVLFRCIWLLSARVRDSKVKRQAQYLTLYGTGKINSIPLNEALTGSRDLCIWFRTLEHR